MHPKQKPCKAISKAKASDIQGCGKSVLKRTYGLCDTCYKEWLLNTPEGNEKLQRHTLKAKGSTQKTMIKQAEQRKRQFNVDSMSKDKYRASIIQPLINKLARLIDNNQPCIASGVDKGKMAGGHYHAVGHNRTLSLNLHNIHIQAYHSNGPQGGDHIKYRHGLIKTYGSEYTDFVDMTLCQCPALHWTKQDLIDLRPKLASWVRELEKLLETTPSFTKAQRIKMRNKYNKLIGIYPEQYSSFKQ